MNSLYHIQIKLLSLVVIFVFSFLKGNAQEHSKINEKGQYKNVFYVKFNTDYTHKLDLKLQGRALKKVKKGEYVQLNIKEFDSQNKKHKVRSIKRLFRPAGKFEEKHRKYGLHLWYKVQFNSETKVDEVIKSYQNIASVEIAEAVYDIEFSDGYTEEIQTTAINNPQINIIEAKNLNTPPNDPRYHEQWHYHNTGQSPDAIAGNDIKLEEAWKMETGNSKVIVAIVDTGFDVNHPDLKGNVWVNSGEIPDNNIDDDNNGYIDDIYGYNFADDTGTIPAVQHGTHVAGTIAAETNNGIGVAGIAGGSGNDDGILLMSNTIFGHNKDDFAEAYVYAADNGAVISQNSWGYGSFTVAITESHKAAIDYFIATAGGNNGPMNGGIAIFAAGNNGAEGTYFPSRYDPVLSVSSVANSGKKASYSNYGTWVDISAPGGDQTTSGITAGVLSTIPGGNYGYLQGTSMACPHASGVAALVVSKFAGKLSGIELKHLMENSTDPLDHLNPSYVGKIGTGRINALKALQFGDGEVSPPSNITVSEIGALTAILQWSTVNKASRYRIRYRKPGNQWVENVTNNTNIKLHNLIKSTTYQVQIRAESFSEVSEYSSIIEFTTISLEVPQNVAISSISQSEALISWDISDTADQYIVRYKKRGEIEWTNVVPTNLLSHTLTELSPNTFYEAQVKASNSTISSIYSETISFLTLDDGSGGCDGIPGWQSDKIYAEPGELVAYNHNIYQNKWWTQNDIPESSSAWVKIDECDPINIGNNPPNVTIIHLNDGQMIKQETLTSIILAANATDSDGTIASIQFEVNGTALTQGNNINWTPIAFGNYTIKVTATDNKGAIATHQISITVEQKTNNQAPTVNITQPNDGQIFEQETLTAITLSANATDSDGTITSILFEVNNTELTQGNNINWTPSTFEDYTIKVTATDDKGATATHQISITVKDVNTGGDCNGIPAWNSSTIYPSIGGVKVSHKNMIYQNKWWTQNNEPGTYEPWGPWEFISPCSSSLLQKMANKENFTILPNPASNLLNIRLNQVDHKSLTIMLYDITGKYQMELKSENVKKNTKQLTYDISQLPKGLYILKINSENQFYTQKIIIK